MTDIVKLYNPANAAALTPEQIANLQSLTVEEIKQLAKAYPLGTTTRAYLLIIDSKKPLEKQLPQLSTWSGLYNLITKNGLRGFVAFGFRGNAAQNKIINKISKLKRSEVLDLSDTELMTLPGFKTKQENGALEHAATTVEVTKVKTKTTNL